MFVLENERLQVKIAETGELYTASRFDWAGIVRQVTLDGVHTFLSEESVSMTAAKNGGIGITGSFEPAPAVFLQQAAYSAEQTSGTIVVFSCQTPKLACSKKLCLQGTQLELTHAVKNLGTETVSFGEYNHNFMLIDGHGYGPAYQVQFPVAIQLTGRKEGHYNRFNLQERVLTVTESFGQPPEDALTQISGLEGVDGAKLPYTWELLHVPTGLYVRETDDFPIWKYQFWCRRDNVCNEVFTKQALEPGMAATWKRIYTFGKKQEETGHEAI